MKKLIWGVIDFRRRVLPNYRETFARLALGQKPDALFIACSDSRVVPNTFASTDPGDLFVVRNVGNLIPPCGSEGTSEGDESEVAAIEFAVESLQVQDIIVCGHSECGAMQAICRGREKVELPHLRSWLRHGETARERLKSLPKKHWDLAEHNELSRLNVLLQIDHLRSYPIIRERLDRKQLRLHAWWFDISSADVYAFDSAKQSFVLIEEDVVESLRGGVSGPDPA